jgi:hypothetical protein
MKERRNGYRVANKDLSSDLCLIRLSFSNGENALARVCDISGAGVRLMIPSDDCSSRLECTDEVSVDFFHAGLSLSGSCVYLQDLDNGVTAVGVVFSDKIGSIILENHLLSAARAV